MIMDIMIYQSSIFKI